MYIESKHHWDMSSKTVKLVAWVDNFTKISALNLHIQSEQQKHHNIVWNVFKVNKTLERRHCEQQSLLIFNVNFEQISHIVLMLPLLTLNK